MNIGKLRILSIGLAVLLIVTGMAGCGSKKNKPSQTPSGTTTESKTDVETDAANAEGKTDAKTDTADAGSKDEADGKDTANADAADTSGKDSADATDNDAGAAGDADAGAADKNADASNVDADATDKADAADGADAADKAADGTDADAATEGEGSEAGNSVSGEAVVGGSENIIVDRDTINNQGGSPEAEIEGADIHDKETGEQIEDPEVRTAEAGNQNIAAVSTPEKDDKGVTSQEITVKDGASAPLCTQAAIEKYIADTIASAGGNVKVSLKFEKPCDEFAQKSYSEFFEKMAAKYGGISFDTEWTVLGLG